MDKNLDGTHGFHSWQWLYIVEGVIAIGLGVIIIIFLPSFPFVLSKKGSRYFNKHEIELAVQRMAEGKSDTHQNRPDPKDQISKEFSGREDNLFSNFDCSQRS